MACCHWKLLILCPLVAALPSLRLRRRETGERCFVDAEGRERFFHGTNAIVKGPPWIPSREGFDPMTSLTAEDFRMMRSAGLNLIRLGVMWPGVEPQRGVYNETYLQIVTDLAREAASYGIYILADMHQDGLSERFCGEGVPLWAVPKDASFPLPLGLPYHGQGKDGLPTRSECKRHTWYEYESAYSSGAAYERLYTNQDNLTNSWGAYWAKVLQSFQGFEGLLGVNLINEPFVGNPYTDPGLMVPEAADRLRLQPAYDVVARHIRAADPDAIIFFPGTTSDRTGRPYTDFLPQGFQHAPGGKEFADRAVNSFHFYAPPQSLDYVKKYFTKRIQDARQLGTGLFLTESCCETFFQNVAPVVESLGMSWIHWEWKQFFRETNATRKSEDQNAAFGADKTGCGGWPYNNGVLNMTMLRYLARPYAQAIAGNFTSSSFDPSSGDFGLIFKADPKIRAPTVISVPELTYPDGVEVLVRPEGAGKFKLDQSLVQLTNNASLAHGEELTIQVKAKRTSLVV